MVLIHEKITALLEQRRLKKRDLARALGVSPQTATDICKGRSAITLPHLRNLVAFFEVRADFWLDDERLLPESTDGVGSRPAPSSPQAVLSQAPFSDRLLQAVRAFVGQRRAEFLSAFPDLTVDERRLVGVGEPGAPHPARRQADRGGGSRMADA